MLQLLAAGGLLELLFLDLMQHVQTPLLSLQRRQQRNLQAAVNHEYASTGTPGFCLSMHTRQKLLIHLCIWELHLKVNSATVEPESHQCSGSHKRMS